MKDPLKVLAELCAEMDAKMDEHRKIIGPQPDDPIAPDGKIWLCYACGKKTKNRDGEERGWDESCMLNCGLIDYPPSPTYTAKYNSE